MFIEIGLAFTLMQVVQSRVLYAIWLALTFVAEGGHFTIFPALACNLYGAQLGAKVYSLLFIGTAIAAILGLVIQTSV